MVHAEQVLAARIEAWIAERREVAGELLGKPADEVTPEDVPGLGLKDHQM